MERAVENVNPAKHDYTRISENKKEYRRVKTNERCLCFLSNVIVLNRRRGGGEMYRRKKNKQNNRATMPLQFRSSTRVIDYLHDK